MAPTKKPADEKGVKQKSLMSFFSKPGADPSAGSSIGNLKVTSNSSAFKPFKAPVAATPKSKMTSASTSEVQNRSTDESTFKTPNSKAKPSFHTLSSSAASGSSGSVQDTPPTSDTVAIDVDMLSDDEEEFMVKKIGKGKRKVVIEDSDEEILDGMGKKGLYREASSPLQSSFKNNKKARISGPLTFSDDEDETVEVTMSFSKKLTQFKKSPAKKGRKGSAADDDDFIVPSDSDVELMSTSSRSRSRAGSSASRSSDDVSATATDDSSAPTKFNSKAKFGRKPAAKKTATSGSTVNGEQFLTAAEQRVKDTKAEKKEKEDAYAFLQEGVLKDKDGVRPGEPGYDPRTLYIPSRSWKDFTPFEKQFWEIKQNHFDTILFFQKGKFLELYEDDARIGHREFDLKLTQRVKMSMVGVPEMSFNFWAAKFLGKGYKVGRVDQAETALGAEMRLAKDKDANKKAKGGKEDKIVRRELNKVYTNGTLVDEELLTDEQAGHCISIREETCDSGEGSRKDDNDGGKAFGICVLDSATSEFGLSAFEDDVCRTKLETLLRQLRPKEIVFTKGNLSVSTTRLLKAILPAACLWTSLRESEGLGYDETLREVKGLYPADGNEDGGIDEDEGLGRSVPQSIRDMVSYRSTIEAMGGMIWYLRTLNIDKDILSMKNFNVYDPMKKGRGLVLDGQTLAHIEVLLNNEGTEEGSLLKLLGRCITPFGKRLFRIWLCMPLREVADINARLDAVQDLIDHPTFEAEFTSVAKGLPDLERIVSRIHAKNCKVKDFLKVLTAFRKLSEGMIKLADTSEAFRSKTILGLLRGAPNLSPNVKNVEMMYRKPEKDTDDLVPQEGKDDVYDEIMEELGELEAGLDSELGKWEKKLGCKLSYWHSAQGNKEIYLVQTKAGQENIPKDWTKSGGTKATSRWLVPSLQPTIRKVKEARENLSTAIKEFKFRLFAEFDTDRAIWLRAIRVFAELDCLFSLAKSSAAIGEPSCRPEFVEGDEAWVHFEELRHPALSVREGASGKGDFIPNDVKLGGDVGRIALLTGPNMGGKSTVMRMAAAGVIMAQLGMLVPAQVARLCPVDAILTRMGAYDNMFSNASTFKVELDECCKILRDATPKSFVVLDELGRGTSTYDGMAIAGAVLHQLATHTLPLSFFATHYGSLTDDFAYHPNIRNIHMSTLVDDEKRELVFLYKLVDGVATGSFGTHVANLAGVPMDVVKRAETVSEDFARQFKEKVEGKQRKSATSKLPLVAQADFVYLYALATGTIQMPENAVRRRDILVRMKEMVKSYIQE